MLKSNLKSVCACSVGHSWAGRVQCHAGTVHEEGGWLLACLLCDRLSQLREHPQFLHLDSTSQRQVHLP